MPALFAQRQIYLFLGLFTKLRNAIISFVLSLCPLSVRMEQLCSYRMDFHEIWYFVIFLKSFDKIEVTLKYDENRGYFT